MARLKRTPHPDQPWCLIWKEAPVLHVIRAHVKNAPWLCSQYGYRVLITDFDVPLALWPGQEWKKQESKPLVYQPPPNELTDEDYR